MTGDRFVSAVLLEQICPFYLTLAETNLTACSIAPATRATGRPGWRISARGFSCAVSAVNPEAHQHLFKRTCVLRPGVGSSCFRVDYELDLTFSFLSSGQVEKAYRMERIQRLCDLVITSMTE